MGRLHAYPPDLAQYVADHWPPARPLTMPMGLLGEALSVAFQASLTSEEARPTRFRLLLTPVDELPESGAPNQGVLRLRFDQSRALTPDELRRLGPSAQFETALIGAQAEEGKLRIWGVAHSGPAWLAPTSGGRSQVPNWTYDPIIHVTGPGQLAVRSAGKLVGALERGLVVDAMMDVFDSEWLPAMFAAEREQVQKEHDALQAQTLSPTMVEHSLVGRVGQHMLRRAIQLVRGARHGGMILVIDAGLSADSGIFGGLRLKYRFAHDEPSRRFRTLLFQILERVAAATSKPAVGWSDFALDTSPDLERLERSVFELSRLIANLTAIDGAVVLDKRLGLLGYGAEVSAELPSPSRVWRALDTEGHERMPDDIENVGTRHRAAYRFVQDHPRGLAIVISHDGGVSFVANRDRAELLRHQIDREGEPAVDVAVAGKGAQGLPTPVSGRLIGGRHHASGAMRVDQKDGFADVQPPAEPPVFGPRRRTVDDDIRSEAGHRHRPLHALCLRHPVVDRVERGGVRERHRIFVSEIDPAWISRVDPAHRSSRRILQPQQVRLAAEHLGEPVIGGGVQPARLDGLVVDGGIDQLGGDWKHCEIGVVVGAKDQPVISVGTQGRRDPHQAGFLALGEHHVVLVNDHEAAVPGETPRFDVDATLIGAEAPFDDVRVEGRNPHVSHGIRAVEPTSTRSTVNENMS